MSSPCRPAMLPSVLLVALAAFLPAAVAGGQPAAQPAATQPAATQPAATQPAGISTKYPGDAGIAQDPAVLLHEDFESPAIDKAKWTSLTPEPGILKLTDKTLDVHAGRQSLEISATMGKDTGGYLFNRFKDGCDKMYARFCVKFAEDTDYIHHFVRVVADEPPAPWPDGRAGIKPAGDDRFSVAIEPWSRWGRYPKPGGWHFYCYWWKMPPSKDGKFWGQDFSDQAYAVPQPGKWYCVEFMAKCNTPGRDDGEAAFWLDGVPLAQHKGINWRSSEKLKLNGFWLLYYMTSQEAKDSKPGKVNRAWFDDIVVATDYVGPPAPGASAPPAPQAAPEGTPTYRLKERVRDVMGQVERGTVPDE